MLTQRGHRAHRHPDEIGLWLLTLVTALALMAFVAVFMFAPR